MDKKRYEEIKKEKKFSTFYYIDLSDEEFKKFKEMDKQKLIIEPMRGLKGGKNNK